MIGRGCHICPYDGLAGPLAPQREYGPLRVLALNHRVAARQFNRAVEDLPASRLYALRGGIDVANVEVVKPARGGV